MPGREEVPAEAMKLARSAALETSTDPVANIVNAAAPSIRNEEKQRIQEALKQPIHVLASTIGRVRVVVGNEYPGTEAERDLTEAAEALGRLRSVFALDTLDPSGEENVERCGGSKILVACDCRPGWDGSGCHHETDCSGKVCTGCPDGDPSGERGES